jgi:hypothetical protein
LPVGHNEHVVDAAAPISEENKPGTQRMHEAEAEIPSKLEYLPAIQLSQATNEVAPILAENFPTSQAMQST